MLRTGRIGKIDRDHFHGTAGLGERIGEALAAQVEGGVADFLIHADGVRDAGFGHSLSTTEPCFVFGLTNVSENPQLSRDIAPGVHGDDRDACVHRCGNRRR